MVIDLDETVFAITMGSSGIYAESIRSVKIVMRTRLDGLAVAFLPREFDDFAELLQLGFWS